jgi:hypothetical protein
MTNKLTLEILAPYLPYGLKVRVEDYKCDYVGREFDEVIGFHQWDKSGLLWSVLTDGGAKPSVEKVKPILRPLSYLTKEIEVNGEKFIPIELLDNYHNFSTIRWGDIEADPTRYPFTIVQKLFEWKFDVFGLIPQSLAIDINTL